MINHFSHPHPLVLVEEEIDWISIIYYCSACKERVEGSSYNCSECDFCLHKSCAELPREINHPFHTSHPLILYEKRPNARPRFRSWYCNSCRKKYKKGEELFVYHCSSCIFDLDIKCALLPNLITGDFPKLKHFSHQHSLFFIQNHFIEPQDRSCTACEEPISGPVYCCIDCQFFLHQKCFELPPKIKHPSHRKHSLSLLPNPPPHPERCSCHLCSKAYKGFIYYCTLCEFGIMIKYIFPDHKVIQNMRHEHPFTLAPRPSSSFICDACGTDGRYCIPYVCTECDIAVHKDCTSLPRNILITRHDHPISHIYYFLEEEQVNKRDCRICQNEINAEYGCYHCPGCDYFVHVNCAMDKDIFIQEYEVTDEIQNSNQINLGWLIGEPSITRVLKEKKIGEEVIAIEIEHFNHPCRLILCDDVKDEKSCYGCRRSIATSFYYCAECSYILHKRCAELPRKTRHWAFKGTFTLKPYIEFKCGFCCLHGSGLSYRNDAIDQGYCISCFLIPDTITTQGHKHQVFFDHKFTFTCSICDIGHQKKGAYICRRKECDHFTLDYTRLALPNTAQYKNDEHPLVLTPRDDIHHHSDQCVCDICEESRDPNEWFYYCGICDNSAHFLCVLSNYPFLKLGLTHKYGFHEHPLTFAKQDYFHGYLKCSNCDKYCKEVFLKCTQSRCKYVIDYECRIHIWRSLRL
ncbi:hypothetical protein SLEP1_g49364 [Rubroshorea leprosula]|uniref:Phorbol-ester/DAG-type domain-containing protein n=1 Tax=Rubroshorea leprosula TaxID=152421 RepID=A0AAV5LWQ8_9ROSI|nr:hypothetical protein SLEP1_g49364 [Rubroshorea leprosula]